MAEESSYPVVTSLLSSHRLRLILNALGGPTGTGSIGIDDFFADQLFQDAVNAWAHAHLLEGSNMTLDGVTDPDSITFISTGTGGGTGSYTDADAIAAVAAAITPEPNMLDKSIVGSVINLGIATALENRITNLEVRSLIQIKDAVSGGGSGNYMNFPSGANYVDTPSVSAFNVSGDVAFYIRFKMPAAAPAADWCLYSRRGSSAATSQFSMFIETGGQMHATTSINGTTNVPSTSTAATPLAFDGNWIWMRHVRESATGQWSFYTAPDTGSNNVLPTTWTTFSLNRGNSAGVMWTNGGALAQPLEVNGFNGGSNTQPNAQFGRFLWYSGLNTTGTLLADANANDYTSGTTWTGTAGNVWTLRGTASIVQAGTTAVSNTATEFTLNDTDAFSTIAVANHDTMFWSAEACLINTSGANANFTPKLQIAGVDLFTWPAPIVLPSAAGSVYNLGVAVKVSNNANDGSQQIARAQLIVNNAVTGTDLGSISMASNLANMSANRSAAIATITSIPQIRLQMTMGTAAPTISARPLRSELMFAKAV